MATATDQDNTQVKTEFERLVNMSASEITEWLETPESKSVGQKADGAEESIGHKSGEHIVAILGKKSDALTDDDFDHMHKVVSYIKRHSAQEPKSIEGSNWGYSLKNWGHDPEKKVSSSKK